MRRNLVGRVIVLLTVVFSMLVPVAAVAQGGLEGDSAYESPQFGYTVTWGEDWAARERDVISNPGGYDTLRLRSGIGNGNLLVQGQGDTESAAAAVERRISIEGRGDDVVTQNLEGDVPMAEMLVGRNKVLIEGYTLEDTDAVIVIVLSARERDFDDVLASLHEQVLFNDGPILTGEDVVETPVSGEAPVDLTDETGEEATAEAPATIVAEPTEETVVETEPANEATAITDEAEDEEEPTVQEPSTRDEQDDSAPAASSVEGGVFESSLYGYTVPFDEEIWTLEDEILNESSDGILLSNELGSLTIWSWDAYGADAAACLAGESEYYASEDPTVEDWEPAEDARGNPIEGDGEGFAWGVYTLTYVPEDGEEVELVDYIECREIPGDDAVVIIFASAAPDVYNDHLELVLKVADAIEIEGDASATNSTGTEEPAETESGLSGSLFTSPAFGFTVEIPAQWNIVDEQLSNDDEILMLTNGRSNVTLRATSAYQGDLAGCVDFAAEESALDLELDVDANGEPFRAEGRREAYAHFRYESEEGEDMTYFVSCQNIVEGESVLILTQEVPYDDFANQRKFRAELQDAIVMP